MTSWLENNMSINGYRSLRTRWEFPCQISADVLLAEYEKVSFRMDRDLHGCPCVLDDDHLRNRLEQS